MDYDIMGVAEHHLDLASAGRGGRAPASGRIPLNLDSCQFDRPWRNQWGNNGNDQATLEIFKAEPLKRWDWTPIFWHLKGLTLAVVFAYFSTGDDAQAANQVKMAQILEFTHSIRTPFAIAADFNMEPDQLWETGWVQSLGQRASVVVPEVGHTCTTGRGRIIDFAVISDSVRPFWRGITPEYNSPCKPHIGICLQFTATPTQVRVRQACFPKNFAFPENCRAGGAFEKAYEVKNQA